MAITSCSHDEQVELSHSLGLLVTHARVSRHGSMAPSGPSVKHLATCRARGGLFSYTHMLQSGKRLCLGEPTICFDVYRIDRVINATTWRLPNDRKQIKSPR